MSDPDSIHAAFGSGPKTKSAAAAKLTHPELFEAMRSTVAVGLGAWACYLVGMQVKHDRRGAWLVAAGALLGLTGVALGAFGAHALRDTLVGDRLGWYQTAVLYHLVHAAAVMAAGLAAARFGGRWIGVGGWCLAAGVVLFSGSLYLMATLMHADRAVLGPVTPLGGVLLLVGWGLFVAGAISATLGRP